MIRLGLRLWTYIQAERSQGRAAPIDPFTRQIKASACHGVPLGGMGSGSIGRGFRGDFRRWQLIPGACEEAPVLANQFSVFISRDGGNKKYSSVLYPGRPPELGAVEDCGISSWDWSLDGEYSTYHAVFPRAWTIYEGEPDPELKISCRQVSPFIPNNYRESCFPSTVFSYTLVNTGDESAAVSLLFTWANSIGGSSHLSGGHFNESFIEDDGVNGVLLHHKTEKGQLPITFAIAAQQTDDVRVSICPCFSIVGNAGDYTAKDMWLEMKEHGNFLETHWDFFPTAVSPPGVSIGAAVAAAVLIQPHQKRTVTFSLVWDSPKVKFMKGRSYYRRYTKFYGFSGKAATRLAHDALLDFSKWEEAIVRWQDPILKNPDLPEWYRFTLFNELYYLVAGGTVWTESETSLENGESLANVEALNICTNGKNAATPNAIDCPGTDANAEDKVSREESQLCGSNPAYTGEALDCNKVDSVECSNTHFNVSSLTSSEDHQSMIDQGEVSLEMGVSMVLSTLKDPEHNCASKHCSSHKTMSSHSDDNVGRFLYLEGLEYVMWCTYDVHFYASFALLALFPKLELSIQREFAAATMRHNPEKTKFLTEADWGIRKVIGAVPHDLGLHDPWMEVNAYNIHDTSRWKDLNSKFVLQVYRDVVATGDMDFAKKAWPAVFTAMAYMDQYDKDRDGLIENDGFPDQTYDAWKVHGISAYCGGLWLAALQSAAAMAEQLNEYDAAESFRARFHQARDVYEKKLWNGSYFNYDSGVSSNSNSIQADQMAGQWYTFASGLPALFEEGKIVSTLSKIHDFNVMKVNGGRFGAVNGMHPNGKVDETCMQSREIWTGVTYAVAATMIHAGMIEQAFNTAEGIFHTGWSEEGFGYWFQTPEGWTVNGRYRSLAYMRPLAIWAMQWALNLQKSAIRDTKVTGNV